MAKLAALTDGPVAYTDATGSQLSIPASLIYFEDGVVKLSPDLALSPGTRAKITEWLTRLAQDGIVTPDTQAPPKPAMVITAKDPGSTGNAIQIQFSNVRPNPANPNTILFDCAVTETDTYTLLTPATVKAVLGTAAGTGQMPGLVFVSSAGAPVQPKNGEYAMTGDPATVNIPQSNGTPGAFSLTSKRGGTDAALTKVTISQADDVTQPGTFTLTAVWTKSAADLQASGLQAAFAYEITVAAPSGGVLAAPAAGTFALSGGAEAKPAANASATIPAN